MNEQPVCHNKYLAFDIETESWPEGEDHRRDLGVTCLAYALDEGIFHWPAMPGPGDVYNQKMGAGELESFCKDLFYWVDDGYKVASINGLGFDFPVLAAAVPHMLPQLRTLALDSFDPAFQMLCERGFMVGLDALAVGLELAEGKTKDMSGALAVELWETGNLDEQRRVIEYVRQDARVTLGIIQTLESRRWTWKQWNHQLRENVKYTERQAICWKTKAGKIARHCLEHGLLTVRECLELPLPNVKWMKRVGMVPWERSKFAGWLDG